MVDFSDLTPEGQEVVERDADRYVANTYDEDNYEKWGSNALAAANGESGFTSATEALANRYKISESDLSNYNDKYVSNTAAAVRDQRYRDGLETFAEEGDADEAWRDRFLNGLD